MSLHRESTGTPSATRPDVALLHGWGLHGGIFEPVAAALGARARVHALDLPGHGRSPLDKGATDLEGVARRVAEHLPERVDLVGWSLGGLVALRLATLFPARVRRLVLVATTPRFVAHRDWPHGMAEASFAELSKHLVRDWRKTVQDFLSLQVRGDERQLDALRELKRLAFAHGEPNPAALAAGLEILRTADLRDELARIRAPTLVVSGEYDRLTPPAAAEALARGIHGARRHAIPRAAHAPFLSHRDEFVREVEAFLGREAVA